MRLVIAVLETRHYTFEGAGTDAPGAHKALSASVAEYLASLGADLTHEVVEYYRERLGDEGGGSITYREYAAGESYRDGELVPTTETAS